MKKKKQQPNPRKKKKSRNNKEKSTITQKSELIKHKKDPNWNRNYKLILSTLRFFLASLTKNRETLLTFKLLSYWRVFFSETFDFPCEFVAILGHVKLIFRTYFCALNDQKRKEVGNERVVFGIFWLHVPVPDKEKTNFAVCLFITK